MKILIAVALTFAASASLFAQAIRDVDFRNFTYSPYCAGSTPENVTVINDEFSEEKQEDGYVDRFYFKVYQPEYGDLNGDRLEEAVILSVCNTGGTGNFSEGFVFGTSAKKLVLLGRIPGGDRAYGGLRSAVIKNGLLVVESNDVGELGGACCPEVIVTTTYRLEGGKLSVVGVPVRREIFPVERIVFKRGTSGITFTTRLPADEGKRFVLGARAGQTLSVSVNSEDASLRLLEDANVTFGINNFLARLPKTGDYTIEVRNNAATEMDVQVNIKIQ
ncbi:MAG: hypothetical protein QUS14_05285 [Pyrinomonadaceae bacterium]|nr:hypothetical protein [Pyrinomonadaceae bacterium]